jgi:hypothetical protein
MERKKRATIMNEQLLRQVIDALHRQDISALDRLHRAFVAEQIQWAKEGHVATARLLYFNGVNIDPALCAFEPSPPKRFPPPPRRVWRRAGSGEIILLRIILFPLLTAWIVLAFYAGESALLHAFGQPLEGRVTALRKDEGRKGPWYFVTYKVADPSGARDMGEEEVSEQRYKTLAVGSPVPVKTIKLRGEQLHELSFSAVESARFAQYGGIAVLTFIPGFIIYAVWIIPLRTRRLIRSGLVIEGVVNDSTLHSKNNQQTVGYTFTPAGPGGERRRGSTTGPQRPHAHPGQHVIVFYDPCKPRHSVAYEFCDFETDVIV